MAGGSTLAHSTDDVKEKVSSSEQGHTGSVDTKILEELETLPVSRQSTKNKVSTDEDGAATKDSGAEAETRWLTGRKLFIVHSAMLLSYVLCLGARLS